MNGKAPLSMIQWDKKISLGHVLILLFWLVTAVYTYAVVASQVEYNRLSTLENKRQQERFVDRNELNLILRSLDELKEEVRSLRK